MSDSILTSTKKILGLADDYTVYDPDVMMHINAAFSTLNQLGIGPEEGFMIEDKAPTWDDFLGTDLRLLNAKQYVYLSVRFFFDPPDTAYLLAAQEKQIEQLAWRLNVVRESTAWIDPDPDPIPDEEL